MVETLLGDRPLYRLRSVQAILRLEETVGAERLEAACARALYFGDPRYRRIKEILNAALDREPLPEAAAAPDAQTHRFARSADEFFAEGEEVARMMTHPLLPKLRQLQLSGMLNTLDLRAAQAIERQLSPIEFLALLLDDELERRSQKRLARRLTQSGCDSQKTLAHFDFAAAPGVNRTLIQDLATCTFITRHENILLCGPTGVGKSHLANALGIEALKRDFGSSPALPIAC